MVAAAAVVSAVASQAGMVVAVVAATTAVAGAAAAALAVGDRVAQDRAPSQTVISYGLSGRVGLVTGAAQGIGAACARRLAREGMQLVLADVNASLGQALAEELGALFVRCDVGDSTQVQAMVDCAVATYGHLDVLVNNAGIFRAAGFLDVTEEDFDAVLRVNLKGAFLVGQAVARVMVPRGSGSIVNMGSVNGMLAIAELSSYNASKGGAHQLTRAMALALADHGIRVNAVAPGTIATELAAQAVLTSDAARQRVLGRTPMKRLGQPGEVAEVVAWLASDAASYITGEVLVADGGRLALNYTVPV